MFVNLIELTEVRGYVKSLEIADNSGSINVTLWNENAKKEWNVGDAIKFQDPQISFRNDSLEINVSRSTSILEPDESEIDDLPTYDELKESIYVPKTIEALEDDDRNVRITGTLKEVFGNKILITKCPSCGNTVDQSSDDFVCSFCGEPIDEPRYLLRFRLDLKMTLVKFQSLSLIIWLKNFLT